METGVRTLRPQAGRTCGMLLLLVTVLGAAKLGEAAASSSPRFEVSFPASVHARPVTGHILVIIGRDAGSEPRMQLGRPGDAAAVFGVDVDKLKPGTPAEIDARSPSSPFANMRNLPAGDYFVQALLNICTEFHRSDGHVIWAHMDQWEGQHANLSPGNLYSQPQKLHVAPQAGFDLKLALTQVVPPVEAQIDTEWVKHVKIQSNLLTQFRGHPIHLGATILLPKGYSEHPEVRYPVIYYDNVPFQWSVHVQRKQGAELEHYEFLADDANDPQPEFVRTLCQVIGRKGSVLAYNSGFESGCLTSLAEELGQFKDEIGNIHDRLWDLLPVMRAHVYDLGVPPGRRPMRH